MGVCGRALRLFPLTSKNSLCFLSSVLRDAITSNLGVNPLEMLLKELGTREKLQEHLVGKGYSGPPIDLEEKILTKEQVILTVCWGAACFSKLVAASFSGGGGGGNGRSCDSS